MKTIRLPEPQVDIRHFRLKDINMPQYHHFWLLLFWPAYYLRYFLVELLNPAGSVCHVMHTALDDLIPLWEIFLIPYGLWMVLMLALTAFTMIYDVDAFKKYIKYLIITITVSTTVFIVYPTCQNLRPNTFERNNFFTWILGIVYQVDTNTNVCPSEHVIGSMAMLATALNCRYLSDKLWKKVVVTISMILVSLSTVFLKQHSLLEVIYALPLCAAAYVLVFKPFSLRNRRTAEI